MERKFLSKMERAFWEELRTNMLDKGAKMKLSVLLLYMDKTYEEIAEMLDIGLGKVSNCKKNMIRMALISIWVPTIFPIA